MKGILCFIDNLGPGGAQRQLVGLASLLKQHKYEVVVAFYDGNRFYLNQLKENDVPFEFLSSAQNPLFRIWYVARYIHRIKPDVVISYLETPSICTCVARAFNRRFKLIVSERNTTQHTGWRDKVRFFLFRIANYIVPNAFAQEKYICTSFPYLKSKVITIPNFVDLNYFVPPLKHERHSIPEIIVAATIWQSKNTLGFIDAVALMKKKGYKFHISWYGKSEADIDYFNQCIDKIGKLELEDCLSLKEKTTSIKERYQEADYFCLPSFYEGTPNVICEAMSCGLPILCSDVCDNGRYVKNGENGFLFDPRNNDSIVEAFIKVFSLSDEDYLLFRKNSRTIAEKMLSKDVFINKYIELIEG